MTGRPQVNRLRRATTSSSADMFRLITTTVDSTRRSSGIRPTSREGRVCRAANLRPPWTRWVAHLEDRLYRVSCQRRLHDEGLGPSMVNQPQLPEAEARRQDM